MFVNLTWRKRRVWGDHLVGIETVICHASHRLCGVLYDLPAVVAGASALWQEPISQRSEIIG